MIFFFPQRKSKWQGPSKPHGLRAFWAGSVAPTIEMSWWAGSPKQLGVDNRRKWAGEETWGVNARWHSPLRSLWVPAIPQITEELFEKSWRSDHPVMCWCWAAGSGRRTGTSPSIKTVTRKCLDYRPLLFSAQTWSHWCFPQIDQAPRPFLFLLPHTVLKQFEYI